MLTRFEAGNLAHAPEGAFALVLEQTREGMFGDPVYGGNQSFAGWDLIGYPGVELVWSDADQQIGTAVTPLHLSVKQLGGGLVSNNLPNADVVIIGLGAAGGIAAHVLTQAGINVVGLEDGRACDLKTFLANDDAISGMIRYWTGQPNTSTSCHLAYQRQLAHHASADPTRLDGEHGRWYQRPLWHPELAHAGGRLHHPHLDHRALRRKGHSCHLNPDRLAYHLRRPGALLRSGRVPDRVSPARPATSTAR